MGKGKRKRDSEAAIEIDASGSGGRELDTPASKSQADLGSSTKKSKEGVEVVYRLADGSKEWAKRLSRRKSLPQLRSKVSKHLSLGGSPDVRLAHIRGGGREVEIEDDYDFQAFRDRAFASGKKDPILVKVYPPGGSSRRRSQSPDTPSITRPAASGSLVASIIQSASDKIPASKALTAAATTSVLNVGQAPREIRTTKKGKGKEKAEVTVLPTAPETPIGKGSEVPSGTMRTEPGENTPNKLESAKKRRKRQRGQKHSPLTQTSALETPIRSDPPPLPPPEPVVETITKMAPPSAPPSALKSATSAAEKKAKKRVSLAVPNDDAPLDPPPLPKSLSPAPPTLAAPTNEALAPRAYSPSMPSESFDTPTSMVQPNSSSATDPAPAPPSSTVVVPPSPPPQPATKPKKSNKRPRSPSPAASPEKPATEMTNFSETVQEVAVAPAEASKDQEPPRPTKRARKSKSAPEVPRTPPPAVTNLPATPSGGVEHDADFIALLASSPSTSKSPKVYTSKKRASLSEAQLVDAAPPLPSATEAIDTTANAAKKKGKNRESAPPLPLTTKQPLSVTSAAPLLPPAPEAPTSGQKIRINLSYPHSLLNRPQESNLIDSSAFSLATGEQCVKERKRLKKRKMANRRPWLPTPGMERNKEGELRFKEPSWEDSDAEEVEERVTEYGVVLDKPNGPATGAAEEASEVMPEKEGDKTTAKAAKGAKATKKGKKADANANVADVPGEGSTPAGQSKKPKSPAIVPDSSPEVETQPLPAKAKPATTKGNAAEPVEPVVETAEESTVPESAPERPPKKAKASKKKAASESPVVASVPISDSAKSPSLPAQRLDLPDAESPFTRFRPLPKQRNFCIICFEPSKHLQVNCPIVQGGLSGLESTANERRKLGKSKVAQDKEWAQGSMEAIENWIGKLRRREEIRRKVTEETVAASTTPAPVPPVPAPDLAAPAKKAAATKAKPKAKAPPATPPKAPAKALPGLAADTADNASTRDSAEAREVEEDVLASAPPSTTKSPPQRDAPPPAWIPRPPSLLRLASEGVRNGSVSGMSASSVAIESDSGSDNGSDTGSGSGAEDDGDSESEDGSSDKSDSDSRSDHDSSDGDSDTGSEKDEPLSLIENPDDLLKHFLTAPLSQKDKKAARKSMEGIRQPSQLSAAADESEAESEDVDASDDEAVAARPTGSRAMRAGSRDSSIGDFEDGQPPLSARDQVPDEDIQESEDDEGGNALRMKGMHAPPTLSTEYTQPTVLLPSETTVDMAAEPRVENQEAVTPSVVVNGDPSVPSSEPIIPSSSLDIPGSLRYGKKSFVGRNRDAESVSVNGLEGAIALEEARAEEAAPERAAFASSPLIQVNGLAASDAEESETAVKTPRGKVASQPLRSPKSAQKQNGLAPSPTITSKASSQPAKTSSQPEPPAEVNGQSHPSHVSESEDVEPVASRTRGATKTPPPSTPKSSRRTPRATPKSVGKRSPKAAERAITPDADIDGQVEEPTTPTPRITRSQKLNLLSQDPESVPLESETEEVEVEYISQDDPAYIPPRSPSDRRSTRNTSTSLPPPSPAAATVARISASPAPPSTPVTPRKRGRPPKSSTPSIPPSSPESARTPRATRSKAGNGAGETPLFISQSQPLATQAYKAVPSTPPRSSRPVNGTPRSTRSAKGGVRMTSPIAEEDESASENPLPNGDNHDHAPSSPEASSVDASTMISSIPLPRPPIRTRQTATLPSASFQPLSSLDKDSLRRGFRGAAKLPSASAPQPRTAPDAHDSSSDDSSDEEDAPNPALKGRYAGGRTPKKIGAVNRGKIGW